MDFLILMTIMIGVAVAAHYCLTHKEVDSEGNQTGELKPTFFGGKE